MMAGSPAFVFMADSGGRVQTDSSGGEGRQLRLLDQLSVLPERAVKAPDSGLGAPAAPAPNDSLAAYVAELQAGSACFCCEAPLEPGDQDSLQCPVCGAAVERPEAA